MNARINIENLKQQYFYFDLPVPYILQSGQEIQIYPISLKNSSFFLSSVDLLLVDKNESSDVKIISMSYLQYIVDVLIPTNAVKKQQFINILLLCLNFQYPKVLKDKRGRPQLIDKDIVVTAQDFEDIKTIILYQNLLNYNDEYINPDIKKVMSEIDYLKNKDIEVPTLERKIAIISAHTGISKSQQLEMTLRSHSLLFEEVCGEIKYLISKPIAIWNNQSDKVEDWIFKNKTNKMSKYFTDTQSYAQSIGDKK